ncbi:hypothetical protein D3C87_1767820 [compost metagenome]
MGAHARAGTLLLAGLEIVDFHRRAVLVPRNAAVLDADLDDRVGLEAEGGSHQRTFEEVDAARRALLVGNVYLVDTDWDVEGRLEVAAAAARALLEVVHSLETKS